MTLVNGHCVVLHINNLDSELYYIMHIITDQLCCTRLLNHMTITSFLDKIIDRFHFPLPKSPSAAKYPNYAYKYDIYSILCIRNIRYLNEYLACSQKLIFLIEKISNHSLKPELSDNVFLLSLNLYSHTQFLYGVRRYSNIYIMYLYQAT